jgi:hypothetical protein
MNDLVELVSLIRNICLNMVGKKSPGMFYFHICVIDIVNDKIIPEGFITFAQALKRL